jgi:TorA maturation chaperone TorD
LLTAIEVLSRIFWGPDSADSHEILQSRYLKFFELLERPINYQPPTILAELETINARFSDKNAIYQHLEQAYVRLFINSRDGIVAPLYASAYADSGDSAKKAPLMGSSAVMMKKRFESKGTALAATMHEPPDHPSIELEYLYFLLDRGRSKVDRSLLAEAVAFAGEVMLPWVKLLQDRIADEKECRFYPLVTSLLVSILCYLAQTEN